MTWSLAGDKPWYLHRGKLLLYYISTFHFGLTNKGREAYLSRASKQFLAPFLGTPVYKIGELHTIFYLCFLVLLVYLSVFTFVCLIKNTKNTYYLSCVVKNVRSWHY